MGLGVPRRQTSRLLRKSRVPRSSLWCERVGQRRRRASPSHSVSSRSWAAPMKCYASRARQPSRLASRQRAVRSIGRWPCAWPRRSSVGPQVPSSWKVRRLRAARRRSPRARSWRRSAGPRARPETLACARPLPYLRRRSSRSRSLRRLHRAPRHSWDPRSHICPPRRPGRARPVPPPASRCLKTSRAHRSVRRCKRSGSLLRAKPRPWLRARRPPPVRSKPLAGSRLSTTRRLRRRRARSTCLRGRTSRRRTAQARRRRVRASGPRTSARGTSARA